LGSSPATPHSLFWQNLIPRGAPKPTGGLAEQIDRDFGSFDTFTREFATAAATIRA
jgi:Fe-Mn family superoxide dismutase